MLSKDSMNESGQDAESKIIMNKRRLSQIVAEEGRSWDQPLRLRGSLLGSLVVPILQIGEEEEVSPQVQLSALALAKSYCRLETVTTEEQAERISIISLSSAFEIHHGSESLCLHRLCSQTDVFSGVDHFVQLKNDFLQRLGYRVLPPLHLDILDLFAASLAIASFRQEVLSSLLFSFASAVLTSPCPNERASERSRAGRPAGGAQTQTTPLSSPGLLSGVREVGSEPFDGSQGRGADNAIRQVGGGVGPAIQTMKSEIICMGLRWLHQRIMEQVQGPVQKEEHEMGGDQRAKCHNLVDILFVIDTTGSMSWCVSELKKSVLRIIEKFNSSQYNIKFALELYRDHPPQEYSYLERHFDLMSYENIITVIEKECEVAGGGDTPEAVMDGLFHGIKKTTWRTSVDKTTKSKRFLFHGCDAPPHGREYGSPSSDKSWEEGGCPCKITRQDIGALLRQYQVDYSLIKCGKLADTMAQLFMQCFEIRFKRLMEIEQKNVVKKHKRRRSVARHDSQQVLSDRVEDVEEEEAVEKCMEERAVKKKKGKKAKKEVLRKVSCSQSGSDQLAGDKQQKCKGKGMKSASSSGSEDCEEQKEQKDKPKARKLRRKRSMASLICSEVESGCRERFEKHPEQIELKEEPKKQGEATVYFQHKEQAK